MTHRTWLLVAAACLALPVLAQQGEAPKGGAAPGGAQARPNSAAERDEIVARVQRAMDELRAAGEELGRRAEKASGEARIALEQQLRSLRDDQKKLESRLQELRAATAQQWKQLQEEIDRTLQQFRRSEDRPQRDTI
jgi:TolA-binding protein